MTGPEDSPLREYVGFIWIGDEPGVRLSVWARSADAARELVEAEYGSGHPYSIWNEEDASRPR
jgi:hypothetical protein